MKSQKSLLWQQNDLNSFAGDSNSVMNEFISAPVFCLHYISSESEMSLDTNQVNYLGLKLFNLRKFMSICAYMSS